MQRCTVVVIDDTQLSGDVDWIVGCSEAEGPVAFVKKSRVTREILAAASRAARLCGLPEQRVPD